MKIWVCPYSQVEKTLVASKAQHLIAFASDHKSFTPPSEISRDKFLLSVMNDIIEPRRGLILPAPSHVKALLDFYHKLPVDAPLLLTCYAGISRSTAIAYSLACASDQTIDEQALAIKLRQIAPSATPNILLVNLADKLLKREGRMQTAIKEIGRGVDAFEGEPFFLTG